MPTTTRQQQREREREQNQEQPYGSIEDRVSECVMMYPVFCTAHIPSKILDDFIDEAYEGWFDLVGDPTGSGASPCILQTTDLDSISHGSRKPMPDFTSPFLNMTDNEIRDWMVKHPHPDFTQTTFTILDHTSIERRISRIGYINEIQPDNRMLWADFFADLYIRVPLAMATISWDDEERVGTDEVLNRKVLQEKAKVEEYA